jgi:LCP family protein required for cell wall assembly
MSLGDGTTEPARSRWRSLIPRRRRESAASGGRPRRSPLTIALGTFAIAVALVLVAGSLTVYLSFRADWDGISRINVLGDLGTKRPPVDPNAINLLLIGSDSRAGANKKFGATVQGQRSDTVMVVHVAPGAHQVDVLSFPRDSVVPILQCAPEAGAPGQVAAPAGDVEQINASFAYGGPGCLWKTIEQTTGIHLNDFIELTFTGFEHVINDIGGVNVCLPVTVNNAEAGLHLAAGKHHVYGREALAFWRARYIGEGSDLQRIQRDQFLMASVLQGIRNSGLLGSPTKLYKVIGDVARNRFITTDTGLTPGRLLSIAESLHGVAAKSFHFIEVPTVPYPGDPTAWVQWEEPQATKLFAAIAHDTRLPRSTHKKKTASGGAPVLASASPADVHVQVLNGTTIAGLATATSARLSSLGFSVEGQPSDAANPDYTTSVIEYPSASSLAAARTLHALVKNSALQLDPAVPAGTVVLILGSTFSGVKKSAASASPSPSSSSGNENLVSQYGGISGNVGICNDSSVFAGPDGS